MRSLDATKARFLECDIDPQLLRVLQSELRFHSGSKREFDETFQRFYEIYAPVIRRFALKCRLPARDLDDCTQDVWCKLVARLPDFQFQPEHCQFQTWLYVLVHNHVISLLRRRNHQTVAPLTATAAVNLTACFEDQTGCDLPTDNEALIKAIDELRLMVPECSYRVLQLKYFEGRSINEIATLLDITHTQASLLLCRVKKRLASLIKRRFGEKP